MARAVRASLLLLSIAAPAAAQFTQLQSMPEGVFGHSMVTAAGYLYVLGGFSPTYGIADGDRVYRAQTRVDGTLGPWIVEAPLARKSFFHDAVATDDRIYVLGGWDWDGTNIANSNRVHYSNIDSSGTPGPWIETTSLPEALFKHCAVVAGGAIYVTGGWTAPSQQQSGAVRYAAIHPDGTLGPWIETTPLPQPMHAHASVATETLYVLGGTISGGNQLQDAVSGSSILGNASLGAWTAMTPLPMALGQHTAVLRASHVFIVGGYDGNAPSSAVYSSVIDSQGALGSWNPRPSLPQALYDLDAVVAGDYLYVAGGYYGSTPQATVHSLNLAACNGDVYVDVAYSGSEIGTPAQPFDTIVEGLAEVCDAGTLWIAAGDYDEATPLSISTPVTLKSTGGPSTIR